MQLTNTLDADLKATLRWIKPPNPSRERYPSGFQTTMALTGARYVKPGLGANVVGFTNGMVILACGDELTFTNIVTVAAKNAVQNQSANAITLTLSPRNGLFKGQVTSPHTGASIGFNGAILQKQGAGTGLFLGQTESGYVYFGP